MAFGSVMSAVLKVSGSLCYPYLRQSITNSLIQVHLSGLPSPASRPTKAMPIRKSQAWCSQRLDHQLRRCVFPILTDSDVPSKRSLAPSVGSVSEAAVASFEGPGAIRSANMGADWVRSTRLVL